MNVNGLRLVARLSWLVLVSQVIAVYAQTAVDASKQTKNADWTGQPFTRPVKTGTQLPSTCNVGDMFLNTSAPAGSNLYACTSPNTWSPQAGGGSSLNLTDFQQTLSGNTITIAPGRVKFGNFACLTFQSPATLTLTAGTGGTGVGQMYISDSCALVLQYPNSLTLTFSLTGITAQAVSAPAIPPSGFPVASIAFSNNQITSVTDLRSVLTQLSLLAGTGTIIDCSSGPCLVTIDPAVVPQLGGNNAYTGSQDASNAVKTIPAKLLTADPSTCTVGEQYYNTAMATLKNCSATNVWTAPATTDNTWLGFAGAPSSGTASLGSGVGIPSSNGATVTSLVSSLYSYGAIQMTHSAATQYVFVTYRLHDVWNGASVGLELNGIGAAGSAGNAYLTVDYECGSADLINTPAFTNAGNATMALDGSGKRQTALITSALSGCSAGNLVTLRINRAGTNSQDTFTGNIYLLGVEIKATHN